MFSFSFENYFARRKKSAWNYFLNKYEPSVDVFVLFTESKFTPKYFKCEFANKLKFLYQNLQF